MSFYIVICIAAIIGLVAAAYLIRYVRDTHSISKEEYEANKEEWSRCFNRLDWPTLL